MLVALALVYLAYNLSRSIAGVMNFSVLGVHPLANVGRALEDSVVTWLGKAVDDLQDVARDLWHGLTWMWGEFLDGINSFVAHTEDAFQLLWGTSIPAYVKAALRPLDNAIDQVSAFQSNLSKYVYAAEDRLDAKIASTAKATARTIDREVGKAIDTATEGIDAEIRAIRSSVDQAIDHALNLARSESQQALGELRSAENAAIGALGSAQDLTSRELHDLLGRIDPTQIASIVAAVPLLATLVNTLAAESGLDNAACRSKVKGICGTDPSDWGMLLAGIGVFGVAFDFQDLLVAGQELIGVIADAAEDDAFEDSP